MVKIYTKSGDLGETSLFSGDRASKNHPLIQAYGTVDELNSTLGVALCEKLSSNLQTQLYRIQHELFQVGADLATPWDQPDHKAVSQITRVTETLLTQLETEIDAAQTLLPPMKVFILPGGCKASAQLHVSRTICRRAERMLVEPLMNKKVNPVIVKYLNRLSDWLFVMARLANFENGVADVAWKKT